MDGPPIYPANACAAQPWHHPPHAPPEPIHGPHPQLYYPPHSLPDDATLLDKNSNKKRVVHDDAEDAPQNIIIKNSVNVSGRKSQTTNENLPPAKRKRRAPAAAPIRTNCNVPQSQRWICDGVDVERALFDHYTANPKANIFAGEAIIDGRDFTVKALFKDVWKEMMDSTIPLPTLDADELAIIEPIRSIATMEGLAEYINTHPVSVNNLLQSQVNQIVNQFLIFFQQDQRGLPHHEGWVIRFMAVFDDLLNYPGHIFVDRGEIQLFAHLFRGLGNRASRVDVAARECTSYNDSDRMRQFAIVEAARQEIRSCKMTSDTKKIIHEACDSLIALQRSSSLAPATLRAMAVPAFLYNGMTIRMIVVTSPGGHVKWVERYPPMHLPDRPKEFSKVYDIIVMYLQAKHLIVNTYEAVKNLDTDKEFSLAFTTA